MFIYNFKIFKLHHLIYRNHHYYYFFIFCLFYVVEKFLNFGELKFARKTSVALKDLTKSPTKLKKNVQEKPALDIPPRNEKKPFVIEDKIEVKRK